MGEFWDRTCTSKRFRSAKVLLLGLVNLGLFERVTDLRLGVVLEAVGVGVSEGEGGLKGVESGVGAPIQRNFDLGLDSGSGGDFLLMDRVWKTLVRTRSVDGGPV